MKPNGFGRLAAVMSSLVIASASFSPSAFADQAKPKKGGILKFLVADEPPSYDGHRETTFALIHPVRPFYSVLLQVNPDNPSSSTDFICDLCTALPTVTDEGLTYTFKIRKDVKFHDGSPLTAHDVQASFRRIIFPGANIASARKAFFVMVENVTAPDDETVVFRLKYPSGAFLAAVANPFNFIYAKRILDKDPKWYEKNIMGSGAFKFVKHVAGATIQATRNPDFYIKDRPYLDGYEVIFAKSAKLTEQALRADRAGIEFRGLSPQTQQTLSRVLGSQLTVQASDWNCVLLVTPNHKRKPLDDARVRRALSLALDRWQGSQYLSKIAIVKTVGGLVFPGHALAARRDELEKIAGYWPDINKSRAEAKRLLKEAGVSNLKLQMNNRAVDQPYKVVGTWVIDQWKQIGISAQQTVLPTGPFYANLRTKKDWDVSIDFNCQSVVNPLLDVALFTSEDKTGNQHGSWVDREMDKMFEEMNRTGDVAKQREIMRRFEKRALDDEAHAIVTLWWYRIVPHRSYVKGWKVSPSHYLNQDLTNVWLDK